jgi:uncharacterized protein
MPRLIVPLRAVVALFLERQHLSRPRAHGLTPSRLTRFAEDVGGLQIDSINVLDRAHYLTVWSRFGPYDRARLDRLVYHRRLFLEYWAHAACFVPASMLPWWRRAMLDYRVRHTGWAGWLRRNARTLSAVKAAIQANGPMGSADFDSRRPGGRGGWWAWRPVQHALHYLWMNGALTVHSRRHFQKRFDLLERVFPGVLTIPTITSEEFQRWHVERSLHAMGPATETDLGRYLSYPRFGPGRRRAAVATMRERGEVIEIEVEGIPGRWLALTRDLPELERAGRRSPPARGTTLLSPFDSLLWHRDRVARLFGFEYRIEVYTPGPQRVHGYYTLPILHQGHLIGRLDAKAYRGEGRLEVRGVHFEPWFAAGTVPPTGFAKGPAPRVGWGTLDRDQALAGLADAIGSIARFVGAAVVTLGRVSPGRLRPPLARALRGVTIDEVVPAVTGEGPTLSGPVARCP